MDKIRDLEDFDKSKYSLITKLARPRLNSYAYTLEKVLHLYRKYTGRTSEICKEMETKNTIDGVDVKKDEFIAALVKPYTGLKANLDSLAKAMGNKDINQEELLDLNYLHTENKLDSDEELEESSIEKKQQDENFGGSLINNTYFDDTVTSKNLQQIADGLAQTVLNNNFLPSAPINPSQGTASVLISNETGSDNAHFDNNSNNNNNGSSSNNNNGNNNANNNANNFVNFLNSMGLLNILRSNQTSTSKSYKLDANTPIFTSKPGENILDWLFVIENNLQLANVPAPMHIVAVSSYLKGTAMQMLKAFRKRGQTDWLLFKKDLLRTFRPVDHERIIRTKLLNLKQTDNFDKFSNDFLYWANQIPEMSEADKLACFMQGLRPLTKVELVIKEVKTINEAILLATAIEHARSEGNNNNSVTKVNYSTTKSKYNNTSSNKYSKASSKTDSNFCYICKSKGHFSSNCPNKGKTNRFKSFANTKPNANNNSIANITCRKCNQKGHYASSCRSAYKSVNTVAINMISTVNYNHIAKNKVKIMSIEGFVNNIKMSIGLDCGATNSIINYNTAVKNNIHLNNTNVMVKTADSSIIPTKGISEPLEVNVNGHLCKLNFIAIDHEDHDILLGLDWFDLTGAGVFPALNLLKFPSENVYLSSNADNRNYSENVDVMLIDIADENDIEDDNIWSPNYEFEIKPQCKLTKKEQSLFEAIIGSAQSMFAKDLNDLGPCKVREHKITTKDDDPIYIPPYRKSESEREIIRSEIQDMLEAKIIRKSNSPWSSPCLLVPKKNTKKKRLVIDYRPLNAKTIQQNWPIPRVLDILDRLSGSIWFTVLDLKSGYWQVLMSQESIQKTAFSTADGHYEFLRLPFGLKNAPAEFSRIMFMVLGNLSFVEIYLDDITIHSKTLDEHVEHILEVFSRLKEANLKLNAEKCTWCAKEIKILGHVVKNNSVAMDPAKIESIKNWNNPMNIKQLQQFLGLCNYYKRFVENFSKIASPLFNLLKKDTKYDWDVSCQSSFDELKRILVSYPILRQPDWKRPFLLYTDASGYAIGAILSQCDDENKEYVCAYASRILKNAEIHYGITEKECLAVVYAVKYFRVYLYGAKFTIITDHSALSWLMSITDPTGRLARWSIYLQVYEFDIIHRKGKKHTNVDMLSRPILQINSLVVEKEEDISSKNLDVYEDEALLHFLKYGRHISGASNKQMKRIDNNISNYKCVKDTIYFRHDDKDDWKQVPIKEERNKVIMDAHLLGHFLEETTLNRIKPDYYWKGMTKDVERAIKNCDVCSRNQKEIPTYHPAIALEVNGIFDRIGIDLIFGMKETDEGFCGILVITEYLTKYPYAKPIKSKSAEEIAQHLLEYICFFGPPKEILSDQGTEFNNELVNKLISCVGSEHRITSAYNPRTNGLTERFNQTLVEALRKHCEGDNNNWHKWIPFVLFAYRTRVHSTTNLSPFELMFGRRANKFGNWSNMEERNQTAELMKRSSELRTLVEKSIPTTIETIKKKQVKQKKTQDKNLKIKLDTLAIGTKVLVKNEGINSKLEPKYKGPYTIKGTTRRKNYILNDLLGNEVEKSYPLHKLKIFESEEPKSTSYEVEKVLDHKIDKKGEKRFLVKWKGFPESENSWEPKQNFNSMKPINEYMEQVREYNNFGVKPIETKTTRPKRGKSVLSNLSVVQITIILIFVLITGCYSQKIKGNFKFCNPANKMPIKFDTICEHERKYSVEDLEKKFNDFIYDKVRPYQNVKQGRIVAQKQLQENKISSVNDIIDQDSVKVGVTPPVSLKLDLYSKETYPIHGVAYQCKQIEYETTFSESFWGSKFKNTVKRVVDMKARDCWTMINTKRCNMQPMICDNNNCEYEKLPTDNFGWFSDNTITYYACYTSQRIISAETQDEHIFGNECTVKDFNCSFHDSIIVWKRDVIHTCPFKMVGSGTFLASGIILKDDNLKLAFQFKNIETHCEQELILTSEGLYLNYNEEAKVDLHLEVENIGHDGKTYADLALADNDYKYLITIEEFRKNFLQECRNFISVLNVLELSENKYIKLPDYKNNEIILFTANDQIYLPTCVDVNEFEIINSDKCYEDVPIKFKLGKEKVIGFLTRELIIRIDSRQVCNNFAKYIELRNSDLTIVYEKTNISLLKTNSLKFNHINFLNINLQQNLTHSSLVLEGINVLKQFRDTSFTEIERDPSLTYAVFHNNKASNKAFGQKLMEKIGDTTDTFYKRVIIVLIIIFSTVALICITILIYKIISCVKCCSKCCKTSDKKARKQVRFKRASNKEDQEFEMQPIKISSAASIDELTNNVIYQSQI
jgi:hypothetical protein